MKAKTCNVTWMPTVKHLIFLGICLSQAALAYGGRPTADGLGPGADGIRPIENGVDARFWLVNCQSVEPYQFIIPDSLTTTSHLPSTPNCTPSTVCRPSSAVGRQPSAVSRRPSAVCRESQEFTRSINREFGTTADGMTALYNKYGKVNVRTWPNNTVKIDITIVVRAKDQREADRTFDRVKVNFLSTPGYVKAETMIEPTNDWFPNECGYEVNYEVWMPVGNQLDLKNKYGNSWVASMKGKLTAEIKYGDLRTEAIYNDADLNISYGKVWMAHANNISGQVSYGGLNVAEANDIQLDSKYSETKVDEAGKLRITSKYDDFTFGNLDELRVQTKYAVLRVNSTRTAYITAQYSDVDIATVHQTLDMDICYGSVDVTTLSRNFNDVNIVAKYTPVVLGVARGAHFSFDAEASNADVHYPSNATVKNRTDTGRLESVQGYLGESNAKSTVTARLTYGDFTIK